MSVTPEVMVWISDHVVSMVCLVFGMFYRCTAQYVRQVSDEERLLSRLFRSYNPSARPVMNSSRTVPVEIMFSLMHIKDLVDILMSARICTHTMQTINHVIVASWKDVRSQVLTTTGLLILEWVDERLVWSRSEHNNLSDVIVEANKLWRPEFAVINGAEKIYTDYNQFRAVVTHEGRVHWEPGGVFKTMCQIDITYYPFDEQRCDLVFGAWSYHTAKMNLTSWKDTTQINLDSYKTNGEWEIYGTRAQRNEFSYECCPNERFANVAFMLFMRRRHTFYVMNVILPSIMTSVLLLSIFFCTPAQKVQIGVVVLLSFRIFLLNVAGDIPKTSDHIPLLGIYLTSTMAITTLSMVLTVFVLNLHHVTDRPVPTWAKIFIFKYMSRVMCMCHIEKQYSVEFRQRRRSGNLFQNETHPEEDINLFRFGPPENPDTDNEDTRTPMLELKRRTLINSHNENSIYKLPHHGNNVIQFNRVPKKVQDRGAHACRMEDHARDWRNMAEVFDRLFFWLFLFAILITTLILFHPLTSASSQIPL